jgi:hypothetical protein
MSSNAFLDDSVNEEKVSPVVWGCDAIGKVIGRSPRQTHHLITKNQIQSVKKVGGRWVAGRAALLREFGASQQD